MKTTLLVALISFWSILSASAQTGSEGKITGKVVEGTSDKPVDFASVVIVNPGNGQTIKSSRTDLNGSFAFSNVPIGSYTLKISFVGFDPYSKVGLVLSDADPVLNWESFI